MMQQSQAQPHPAPVVLVVEDDPTIRDVLGELLEFHGYCVEYAEDGLQGLARIEAGGIDLVLLDVMLPRVDGLEVCRRVRADEGEGHLPIIILTARGGEDERVAGFAAGADDYVAKPFNVEELLARVRVWLERQRAEAALRRAKQTEGRLEGIILAAREMGHLLNNDLQIPVAALEILQHQPDLPADLREMVDEAASWLAAAEQHVHQFQQVVRVETKDTPVGPALDLQRSTARPPGE